jgi:hypothetical protein
VKSVLALPAAALLTAAFAGPDISVDQAARPALDESHLLADISQ